MKYLSLFAGLLIIFVPVQLFAQKNKFEINPIAGRQKDFTECNSTELGVIVLRTKIQDITIYIDGVSKGDVSRGARYMEPKYDPVD